MFRTFALGTAFLLPLTLGTTVHAESRGLTVELRAAPEATAPVAGHVELYTNSYALVIGNDAYSDGWPSLSNAIADAREIAAGLSDQGFEVTLVEDLDSVQLRDTLREFFAIKGADPEARLLLWYAGHGHSIKGEGFLVPIDAPAPTVPEFKVRSLHMRDFGGLMRLADSKHVLAIFDSCFSGTIFTTRAGAVPAAITRITTQPTRQFMTSGDAEQQVSDDGTFRRLFLRALAGESEADSNGDGYLTGTELGLYLSDTMVNYTEDSQTPRYGKLRDPDYDRGDFVFALPGRQTVPLDDFAATSPATNPDDITEAMAEITLWTTLVVSQDPAVVQTYLDAYPTGRFAKAAIARIEELETIMAKREAEEAAKRAAAETDDAAQPALPETPAQDPVAPDAEETAFMPDIADTDAAPLTLKGGVNLSKSEDGQEDSDWLPSVSEGSSDFFQLTARRDLPAGFFGSGGAVEELDSPDKTATRDVGPQGYRVAGSAWTLSDPQGDSQYKIDQDWIHMRAPGSHDIWNCNRGLAPILSVPAPASDTWSAQVWFQLPARIGRSHVGLALWNGREDSPVHTVYFGPSDTKNLPVSGSYRSDCSGGSTDLRNRDDTSGRFNLEYSGGRGWLRMARNGDTLSFYFKSPHMHNWHHVGTMQVEGKDNLTQVGLITKTWGSEPVVASFADFRLIPGHADVEHWTPQYFGKLASDGEITFRGEDFADFEWNDPAGDSIHEITDSQVTIKASGGRDMWNCDRSSAPILSVDVPPLDRWSAEVDFDLPARIGQSHIGLVAWNGEFEDAPVHNLYFGPSGTGDLGVAGSNAIDCTSHASDLRSQLGSSGLFNINYNRSSGRLRIARDGDKISFFVKSPEQRNWEHVGTTLASVRDAFDKIGLVAKTWGSEPVNVTFSNFRIIAGETEPDRWFPSYYAKLRLGEPVTFAGEDFADFEWSDPDGNSVHEIRGSAVRLQTSGGHNGVWNCDRNKSPILSVAVPPRDAWVAQVRYRMGPRKSSTTAGITLWNGAEHGDTKQITFGPINQKGLNIGGAYSDDCTAYPGDLAKHAGNSGTFMAPEGGDEGILQIVKFGAFFKFRFFDPATNTWSELGTLKSSVKDNFNRIGLTATSWGNDPVEVEFRDFTLVPGMFN
ncbi:caspase family protein [uncultured Pelagimonas sp.]|uniref:caspase family protein n=1 Tax=uncultured Pelagimonas sp. TaxID=1618102 RepID=UPI002630E699|nr:caspase family protein [uncultured Pelagimonas sp.]